jgi:hypothetical protein
MNSRRLLFRLAIPTAHFLASMAKKYHYTPPERARHDAGFFFVQMPERPT